MLETLKIGKDHMIPRYVIQIGPDINLKGGISSVEKTILSAWTSQDYAITPIWSIGNNGKFPSMIMGFFSFCKQLLLCNPEIIHIHFSYGRSIYRKSFYILVSFLFGKKIVLHAHGSRFDIFYQQDCNWWQKIFIKKILNLADCLIVLSNYWREFYKNIYYKHEPRIIFNSVQVPRIEPFLITKDNVILFLGRISKRKGIYVLLDALPKLITQIPNVQIWLGGDGEVHEVFKIIREKGWGKHVKILGWVSGETLQQIFLSARVFVLPSYNEGLPMAILEAMANGLPVVSTPIGGIPEAVMDQENGFLVPPGDSNALAEAISKILLNPILQQEMGKRSIEIIKEKFDVDNMVNQIQSVYDEILGINRETI